MGEEDYNKFEELIAKGDFETFNKLLLQFDIGVFFEKIIYYKHSLLCRAIALGRNEFTILIFETYKEKLNEALKPKQAHPLDSSETEHRQTIQTESQSIPVSKPLNKLIDDNFYLHYAAHYTGNKEAIEYMLKEGASLQTYKIDIFCNLPLHVASYCGNCQAIEIFISHGAKVNSPNKKGSTALHEAARCGRKEAVILLMSLGANAQLHDNNGWTPMTVEGWPPNNAFKTMEPEERTALLKHPKHQELKKEELQK